MTRGQVDKAVSVSIEEWMCGDHNGVRARLHRHSERTLQFLRLAHKASREAFDAFSPCGVLGHS